MRIIVTVEEITFRNGNLMTLEIRHLFKLMLTLSENALRFVTDVVFEYFAMLSRFHSCRQTHDAGSVMRIAFKCKLTDFRKTFLQSDFSVHYFVFVYS